MNQGLTNGSTHHPIDVETNNIDDGSKDWGSARRDCVRETNDRSSEIGRDGPDATDDSLSKTDVGKDRDVKGNHDDVDEPN